MGSDVTDLLLEDLRRRARELAPRAEVLRIPDASHWVQADAPGRVSALLLDFLFISLRIILLQKKFFGILDYHKSIQEQEI